MKLIGRKSEKTTLSSLLEDDKPHMLAIIGRRRVGKTFLVRQVYKKHMAFEMTGYKDANLDLQLQNFSHQIHAHFKPKTTHAPIQNWLEAFNLLSSELEKKTSQKKKVVFFDELPWIATKRSGFLEALGHWWNNWASKQKIVVVICGSAASWMIDHVVNSKGGLHNRITQLISLQPFTLAETAEFLRYKKINLSHYHIIQIYMAIGGIPLYLDHLKRSKSASQNIQELCFSTNGFLRTEFDNLYPALFDSPERYINVIRALASKSSGLSRPQILQKIKLEDGGWFSTILSNLETSGFISSVQPLTNKKKQTLYRLTDEYSLFYLKFIEGKKVSSSQNWNRISTSQSYKIWTGYAFENLCMKHVNEIKSALEISGITSDIGSYLHVANDSYDKGFQIDMLIDRSDDIINICEMKFYNTEFKIDAAYSKNIRNKRQGMATVLNSKKSIHVTFISTYGLVENSHKLDAVDNDFTIDIFFS